MYEKSHQPPCWHTASFGSTAEMSRLEQAELGAHLTSCQQLRGRLHYLKTSADLVHGLVSAHFITCTLVVSVLAAVGYVVL
jgi:hypothetical protein